MTGDIMRAAKNIDHIDFARNVGQLAINFLCREFLLRRDSKPAPARFRSLLSADTCGT